MPLESFRPGTEELGGESQSIVFTDGASRGNPGPGGWGVIVVSKLQLIPRLQRTSQSSSVIELGGREESTTNNRMELKAAIEALERLKDSGGKIKVFSDSHYLVNGASRWLSRWRRNDWRGAARKEIKNRDLWERLSGLIAERDIEWHYISGHVGSAGNERADEIATAFARGSTFTLYSGPFGGYPLKKILDVSLERQREETLQRGQMLRGGRAYSYVSLVDGRIERHSSWRECETRVKGKAGAKYRKALSKEHEQEIINEWQMGDYKISL